MPGLTVIKILGWLKFMSHALKLPTSSEWDQPAGDVPSRHYDNSMPIQDKIAIPTTIPPAFLPQNMNKHHQESCDKIGKDFQTFMDKAVDAVVFAHNMWKLQAKFTNLKVMGPSAIGTPGCLSGPDLESFIKTAPTVAAFTGNMAKYRDAVAAGVSKCFKSWQGQVMVPGLPWYPAFVAFPGPMAPPMPNVPMPLITCPSAMMADITAPMKMASEMESALDGGLKDMDKDGQYKALFDAIATVLALAFLIWLPSQQVMLVMGMGPIPTFAPPFVPVGPVLNGNNLGVPGHLLA